MYRFSPPTLKTQLEVFLCAEICRQCRGKLDGEILEAPVPTEETAASAAFVASDPGLCEESRDGNQQTAASAASGLSEKPQEGNIKEVRLFFSCSLTSIKPKRRGKSS